MQGVRPGEGNGEALQRAVGHHLLIVDGVGALRPLLGARRASVVIVIGDAAQHDDAAGHSFRLPARQEPPPAQAAAAPSPPARFQMSLPGGSMSCYGHMRRHEEAVDAHLQLQGPVLPRAALHVE